MAGKRQESPDPPSQETAKGLQIPVPKRGEIMDALKKVAPPVKPKR
jgi:hypothetical protein